MPNSPRVMRIVVERAQRHQVVQIGPATVEPSARRDGPAGAPWPTQPGNRQPRSRSSTNRRVRSGTIRNALPTLTGTPDRSHSGCSVPSQVSFATRCPGSRGRPFNQPPSASRCTYTRNESRRLTDSTDPSDRPHSSSSAPAQ